MLTHSSILGVWVSIALAGLAHAHQAPFHQAMFCFNGTDPTVVDYNNNEPVQPLWNLPYSDFWMHHSNGCDQFPPDEGVFLDIPSPGSFTVEIASNRGCTTLSPNTDVTEWGDCQNHPDDYDVSTCITSPNLHTQNETMAAGTSFAIAYESEVSKVTPNNLVVFTVRYYTPWKRTTTYDVPAGLPPCPEGGCLCTFNWIPKACGEPNIYMFPYRCQVIPASGSQPLTIGPPKPAVWCEDDPSMCVQGPKQVLLWNQLDSNNIEVSGSDLSGSPKSPAYNMKCGFPDGAQNIFVDSSTLAVNNSTTASGTPTSGTPTLPSSAPASNLPSGSGTAPASNLPTGSGTPTLPSSAPASNLPSGSGTQTLTNGTCNGSAPTTAGAHSKRMKMRRDKHNVF